MRRLLIITIAAASFLSGNAAFAQMPSGSSPGIRPTSPFGMSGNPSVAPAGIPMGATELGTSGISSLPFGVPSQGSMVGSAAPCATGGSSIPGMSGTSSVGSFDGGGISPMSVPMASAGTTGMGAPGNGTSPCVATSGGNAVNPLSSSTISSGGRAGIPMGSVELGNVGVSGLPAIPTPSATPSNILPGSSTCPSNKGEIPATPGFPSIC